MYLDTSWDITDTSNGNMMKLVKTINKKWINNNLW